MNDYGLTVSNNNGRIMFDSRLKMDSYVITEISTGSQTLDTTIDLYSDNPDYIFVKPPAGQASSYAPYVIYSTPGFSSAVPVQFKGWNSDDMSANNGQSVPLNMDYFIAKHSSKVSSDEDYGLIIYNSDQSIQFDSRSITYDQHFTITTVVEPGTFQPYTPNTGADSLGDITDYWEIGTWTAGLFAPDGKFVQGIKFVGGNLDNLGEDTSGPIALTYYATENDDFENPETPPGGPGGTTSGPGSSTSNSSYKSRITKQILSAELV